MKLKQHRCTDQKSPNVASEMPLKVWQSSGQYLEKGLLLLQKPLILSIPRLNKEYIHFKIFLHHKYTTLSSENPETSVRIDLYAGPAYKQQFHK